ncbi:MAG: oligopeptide transporter, OPT family [Candidatus Marinimicrobia bacterium]|nr:oligopeptide transporter, OPT family [Candidatus Neomarinimicrobiota bacterium]
MVKKGLPAEAYEKVPAENYVPYVPSDISITEFTIKSLLLGALFGILFGMANAYLGLMAGLTISTAIPLAVITIAVAKAFEKIWGKTSILENNITKTAGSASSSLASGIIFTIPALYMWSHDPGLLKITLIALFGGLLGVVFMIPLRKFLIWNEHGNLPYPEGIGSAEVLVAADTGGTNAKNVFTGLGIGLIYTSIMDIINLWTREIWIKIPFIKKASIGMNTRPSLLGVGYILGFKIALIMAAGGLLSWLIIIPAIAYIGENFTSPLYPETNLSIKEMSPDQIWTRYIRYIGAGAVATAGFITLIKSIPIMISSFKVGIKNIRKNSKLNQLRTDTDLSMKTVLAIIVLVVLLLTFIPYVFDYTNSIIFRLITALWIVLFAFFFTTVSSRIVGLVGVTSNPTSGMIIATLILTSLIFLALGFKGLEGKIAAISVGAIVGCAASIAGDTSQDLKTGFLIGATPKYQQIAEIIGVITTCFFVAGSVLILGKAYGFGSKELPAPQANMMKMVVDGVIGANIPWIFVLIGVCISLFVHFVLKLPSLAFAVGVYLPVSTMIPILIGGTIRKVIEKKVKNNKELLVKRREKGILFGSGLVGGDGLMGVVIGLLVILKIRPAILPENWAGSFNILIAILFFAILSFLLVQSTKTEES